MRSVQTGIGWPIQTVVTTRAFFEYCRNDTEHETMMRQFQGENDELRKKIMLRREELWKEFKDA